MNVLRLRDEADGPFVEVVPYVDGHSLVALVEAFEALLGYDEPGTYAGLPRDRAFDPDGWLPQRRGWPGRRSWGTADVLACACGEVGCWPLTVRISAQGGVIVWDRFEQPHRPDRDYSLLGSFVFDAVQYARALRARRGG